MPIAAELDWKISQPWRFWMSKQISFQHEFVLQNLWPGCLGDQSILQHYFESRF